MYRSWVTVLSVAVLAAALSACARKQPTVPEPLGGELAPPSQSAAPLAGTGSDRAGQSLGEDLAGPRASNAGVSASDVLKTVYFDYDRADLRPDQRPVLDQNYEYLTAHPDVRIIIEGNCDERGTVEYNFALGDRRASEVRKYLVTRGVNSQRISTISKGEEEPVDPGHNEAAWAKNRRAEFKFQ